VQDILRELKEQEKKSINTTDPDCVSVIDRSAYGGKVKGRQGIHAGYNGQIRMDAYA